MTILSILNKQVAYIVTLLPFWLTVVFWTRSGIPSKFSNQNARQGHKVCATKVGEKSSYICLYLLHAQSNKLESFIKCLMSHPSTNIGGCVSYRSFYFRNIILNRMLYWPNMSYTFSEPVDECPGSL